MPKKKFALGQTHGFLGEKTGKAKPKKFVESGIITAYRMERDKRWYIEGRFTEQIAEIWKDSWDDFLAIEIVGQIKLF